MGTPQDSIPTSVVSIPFRLISTHPRSIYPNLSLWDFCLCRTATGAADFHNFMLAKSYPQTIWFWNSPQTVITYYSVNCLTSGAFSSVFSVLPLCCVISLVGVLYFWHSKVSIQWHFIKVRNVGCMQQTTEVFRHFISVCRLFVAKMKSANK